MNTIRVIYVCLLLALAIVGLVGFGIRGYELYLNPNTHIGPPNWESNLLLVCVIMYGIFWIWNMLYPAPEDADNDQETEN